MFTPRLAVTVAGLGLAVILGLVAFATRAAPHPDPLPEDGTLATDDPLLGRRIYVRCQACHGLDGQGIAGNYPPLAGNPVLLAADPTAAIQAVLRGRPRAALNGQMPAFAELADHELAAVLTWARSQWGNHAEPVTPAAVARQRSHP
jgi:mono/diheme cytochrome c family protein